MTFFDFREFFLFILIVLPLTIALGHYMKHVFTGKSTLFTLCFRWLENACYAISGVDKNKEMSASTYLKNLLVFNLLGFLAVFILMLAQSFLPLNPQNFQGTSLDLSFNTAISFMTNTNWQSYTPETTLSYLTQMMGLSVQNFLSAATGLAVLTALIRGIISSEVETIGNFFVDLIRSIVYILLPLSIILACFFLSQGVIQSFSPYLEMSTLEGAKQTLPFGPAASQVAIKQLGTNGGGFFNANSAHPFENPSGFTNFCQILSLILIPSASIYFYGLMTTMKKHALILYCVIFSLFTAGLIFSLCGEYLYGRNMEALHVFEGPVFEGKEMRFGIFNSIFWSEATTATSTGAVNAEISSLSPIASGISLFNMMIGEVVFGGIGVGLCSLIMFILLTVFLSGLMVGRTPEYMGKKIELNEMRWIMAAILIPPALILMGSAISAILNVAVTDLDKQGPHGLTTILYAFTSTAANNGSAFANLNANTPYYNYTLGIVMLIGRLAILIPSLMMAGLLAKKKALTATVGTFSTNSPLFAILLLSVIILVGALSFFPALALGPIMEQFLMMEKRFF